MKFCQNCGSKSKEDATFCVHCGQHFKEVSKESVPTQPDIIVSKKPMTKKNKILFMTLGAIGVLLLVTHLILSNIYNPMKSIQAMNDAYNAQDKEAFFNEFHVKKGTVADAQNFYGTVTDYGWTDLRDSLTYEVEKVINKEHANIIYNRGEFISVNQKPILFGLYNEINFTIIPMEVSVHVPYKNMTIRFGDEEMISEEDDVEIVIGHFITGDYKWSYEYDGGLMPLSGEADYTLFPQEGNVVMIEPDWNFITLSIESDVDDAILFVDGKSTGKTVGELYEFYPAQIRPDSKIHAQTEDKDGNEVKSSVLPVDNDYLYLDFEHIQQEHRAAEHEEVIRKMYKDFRSDYEDAITYTNFNYIADYFKEGSKIKQDYAKFVSDHNNISGYRYDFLLNDILSFKELSETEFELQTFETFNFSSYDDGDIHYERKKKYTIVYTDGVYTIKEILDVDTKKNIIK